MVGGRGTEWWVGEALSGGCGTEWWVGEALSGGWARHRVVGGFNQKWRSGIRKDVGL